eukprot:1906792-Pyramimonas_sp.AAC.1
MGDKLSHACSALHRLFPCHKRGHSVNLRERIHSCPIAASKGGGCASPTTRTGRYRGPITTMM